MTGSEKDKRESDFLKHFFVLLELVREGNPSINERAKKYNSLKQFNKKNYVLANIPEKYLEFTLKNIKVA